MLSMKLLRFTGKILVFGPIMLSLGLAALLAGCEGEKDDPTGAEAYVKSNPYVSEERPEPLANTLEITPAFATISIIGREIIFTVSGGDGAYHWYISNDNGELNSHGANQVSYKVKKVGNNDVIVQDESGHYAVAHIYPKVDAMSITPADAETSSSSRYVAFTVSGGTPPYVWTSGSPNLGTISYSSATSYTAGYTAASGAYGQNIITVMDAEGRIATATVSQSQ